MPSPQQSIRRALSVGGALLLLLGFAIGGDWLRLPRDHDPLLASLGDGPGVMTRYRLMRIEADPLRCQAALASTDLRYTAIPDRQTGQGCGFANAVRVSSPAINGVSLTCPMAAAWALFEQGVLQPAAMAHFGKPVAEVKHFGSYSCRNLYNRQAGSRSQHATANAFDVAGFVIMGGPTVSVKAHWRDEGAKGAFLRQVRAGACRLFDTVLSPDANAAHADHFHFDMGPWRSCR